MDNEGGGKIRNKRSHEQPKPYSRRKSLLNRVGDTVKDMLAPSWIVDLVSSVKKKPPPESSAARITESHNGGNTPRQMDPVQRNFNAMPELMATPTPMPSYLPQGGISGAADTPSGSGNDHLTFTSAQLPFPHYNHVAQPIINGGDDQSEHSEYSVSTTGCSSMMPHPDRGEYQRDVLQLNDSKLVAQPRHGMSYDASATRDAAANTTHNMSNRLVGEGSFLWSSKAKSRPSQPQPAARSQKPSFNVSSFGTSILSPEKSSLFGTGFGNSPYYPGKTAFGGAASHRKSKLSSPAPYEVSTPRSKVEAKPRAQANAGLTGVSSSTARLILDTLDRMSTPLSDAKKIPSYENVTDSPLSFTPGSYRRRNSSFSMSKTKEGPPINKIASHGVASIAKNRHRPPTYQIDIETTTQQTVSNEKGPSPEESSSSWPAPQSDAGGGSKSGKVRRERGGQHYSSKNKDDDEEVEVPDLPTGFTLPVGGALPSFSFGGPAPMVNPKETVTSSSYSVSHTSSASLTAKKSAVTDAPVLSTEKPHKLEVSTTSSSSSSPFTFSSPIAKSPPHASVQVPSKETFKFSSPIKVDPNSSHTAGAGLSSAASSEPKPKQNVTSMNENNGFKPASQLKSGSVMDVLGGSSSKAQTPMTNGPSMFAPAAELKKGSVMDILGKSKTGSPSTSGVGIPVASELKSGSVMDILKPAADSAKTNAAAPSLSHLFQKPSGSWECDACMVQNKPNVDKCVACESKRPAPKSAAPAPPATTMAPSGNGFGNLFKAATGSWSCDTCMVQNKPDVSKCVACETPKPSAKPTVPPVLAAPVPSGAGFGNLFSKPTGWECSTCLVQNKPDVLKCAACETPKPGAQSTASKPPTASTPLPPTGSGFANLAKPAGWSCSTCLVQNKTDATKCAACETPKPGAKPSVQMPAVSNSFGSSFAAPKNSWNCDTCMVTNKSQATKCIACETPKPGAQPTTGFTTTGGFKFSAEGGFKTDKNISGLSSANFGSGSTKLGTDSTSGATMPVSGGFKFGGDPAAKSDSKPVFGNVALPSAPDKTSTVSSSVFGGPTETSKLASAGSGFKFGGESVDKLDSKPTTGGFKFGDSDKSKTVSESSQPLFGTSSTVVSPASTVTDSQPTGGSIFGSATNSSSEAAKPAGGFTFGQKTVESDKPPASSGAFTFGAKDNKPAPAIGSVFGSSQPPSGAGTSIFGSAASDSSKSKDSAAPASGTFQFGAQDKSAGGFVFGSTPKTEADSSKPAAAAGTFVFGATKSTTETVSSQPAATASVFGGNVSSDKADVKPTSGAFVFGSTPAAEAKPSAPLVFGVASKAEQANSAAPPSYTFGTATSTAGSGFNFTSKSAEAEASNKRGRDELDGGAPAKKAATMFGSTGSSTAGSASNFKFGENPAPSAPTSSMFSFSANKQNAPSATSSSVTPSGFAFGQTTAAPTKPAESAMASILPQFPAPNQGSISAGTATLFGPPLGSDGPSMMFQSSHDMVTDPPAFPGQSSGFAFGSTGTSVFGSSATAPTANSSGGMFQFSANSQPQSQPAAGSTPGSFTFGQPTPNLAAPAPPAATQSGGFNFTAAASANTNFNFGAPAPQQNNTFQFNATAPNSGGPTNPFSVSGTPSSAPRRNVKKAIRRIPRK